MGKGKFFIQRRKKLQGSFATFIRVQTCMFKIKYLIYLTLKLKTKQNTKKKTS